MEQFSLEKWLQDKSRKVVTRDGKQVRIICWDAPTKNPIYGFVEGGDGITSWRKDGRFSNLIDNADLFFADEEEELTEFEKQLGVYIYFPKLSSGFNEEEKKYIKDATNTLISLARKELEKDIEYSAVEFAKSYMEDVNPSFEKVKESEELWKWKMSCLRGINKAYKQGKKDALKDLPKWKKSYHQHETFVWYNNTLFHGEYQLSLDDLDNLPKEE